MSGPSPDPPNAPEPDAAFARSVIAVPLPCRGCGYELRGLPANRACPECGLAAIDSLLAVVDPHATRLPQLGNPRRVGQAVFVLVTTVFAAALLLAAGPVARRLLAMDPRLPRRIGPVGLGEDLTLLSAVVALLGLWSVWALRPRRAMRTPPVARDLRLLALGLVGWSIAAAARWWLARLPGGGPHDLGRFGLQVAIGIAAIAVLLGLAGVLRTIGRRSRAYRQSHATRQGAIAMIAAVVGLGVGQGLQLASIRLGGLETVAALGAVVRSVCGLMALIGLGYMEVNAWWIRRALRKPPPRLAELLAEGE